MVTRLLASGRGRNAAIAAFRAAIELNSMYTIAHVDLAIAAGIRANTGEAVTELPIAA